MIGDPNQQDDSLNDTARDYLGQPSPLAFKNQPALPAGGGSIGVGAGPNTTAGGKGIGAVKGDAAFADLISSLGLDPSTGGGGPSGGAEAAAGATAEGPGITGFDPTTANIALNTMALALGVPGAVGAIGALTGAPGIASAVPSSATAVPSLGKLAQSILGFFDAGPKSNMTMQTAEGPVSVAPTYTGFFSALANALTGQSNFASVDPSTGQTMPAPPNASTINSSITGLGPGQASQHGAPSLSTTSVFGADPATAFALNAQGRGDEGNPGPAPAAPAAQGLEGPPGVVDASSVGVSGAGDGGGGGTFLCTALHKRGWMDDATLRANKVFSRRMTRAQYAGYARWARPLAAWADRHPGAACVLYAVLGWMPRAYMAEIRQPGSSRLGRVILAVGLRACARLGA